MHKSIAILGRQPSLGLAELESLYGNKVVSPFGDQSVLLDLQTSDIKLQRLGGVVKTAQILAELKSTKWSDIEKYLFDTAPAHAEQISGKLTFGISVYGLSSTTAKQVAKTALLVKKSIKNTGQSVRMVPHKDKVLGSAVVIHNNLTSSNGWELLIISDGKKVLLAKTVNIQDIDAYSKRDQARPKRDAKVGMLPPKLAQIIINLAVGQKKVNSVLDPFCGTGVVLQEALLMNYDAYGSDIDQRMVDYTIDNLNWLLKKHPHIDKSFSVSSANATTHNWDFEIDSVAAETFLGHPLSRLPESEHLSKIIYEANVINHRFLQNISKQLKPGTRLCLGIPAWRGKHEFLHLPMLDHLTDMGYTRLRFKHVENKDLIYHREGQVVGRELLVLIKN